MVDALDSTVIILVAGAVGILFACFQLYQVSRVSVGGKGEYSLLQNQQLSKAHAESGQKIYEIYCNIQAGAKAFLGAEYKICFIFIIFFGALVFILTARIGDTWDWTQGGLTCASFVVGGLTSMISGYIGMMTAVYSNARTTVCAQKDGAEGWTAAFNTAFRAGGVMGFLLTGLALLVCYALMGLFNMVYPFHVMDADGNFTNVKLLFECLSGYGLGGSSIAMFGRVGGGIYTKAADVGADLAGKVIEDIPEDDPRNPATIADNVGDNVGDVAGMGSDLFGSFAEATCAALVVASQSVSIVEAGWQAITFPLIISAIGILVCCVTSFVATDIQPVRCPEDVEKVLKVQIGVSTILMTIVLYPVSKAFLPASFILTEGGHTIHCSPETAFASIVVGLWGGCLIGFITEYYTSHSYRPTQEVAESCRTGAATNIIYGLALGYKSLVIPVLLIAIAVFVSFTYAGMYGVALSALGMLGTLATCLSIDVYGPVCDNAGGIAEMAELEEWVREKTDALDAAGNTTAAIGKGFAIGSAALVALALFGAFVTRCQILEINILRPVVFAWIFVGAMVPYAFTAMTMKSVGTAAMEMVKEVQRQFDTIPGLREGTPGHGPPDHARCIKISTDASLREMVWPGLLVILSPILCGTFFGVEAVSGLLTGSITSGVQLAISQSNSGGSWDNAKKYIEKGDLVFMVDDKPVVQKKGSEAHKAAVTGDTVGDPLKDTSGPAINIVMKLQAIISLVFANFFMGINNGEGIFRISRV